MRPETAVENYLHRQVAKAGGTYRRVAWVGRRNAPDDLIAIPGLFPFFVECKADKKKKPRIGQLRDHARLRKMGFKVFVVSTREEVDRLFAEVTGANHGHACSTG